MQEPTFLILTALAGGPQHGYGVISDAERISAGRTRLRAGTRPRLRHRRLLAGLAHDRHPGLARRPPTRRAVLGAVATAAALVALTTTPLFDLLFPEPVAPVTPESLRAFLSRPHWWNVLQLAASGTIDGSHSVSRLLVDGLDGLVGFALVMLCVRLADLPFNNRAGDREQHPA